METVIEVFGEAEHLFFDPSQSTHHAWAKDMAARHIGRGTTFWIGIKSGEPIGLVGLLHDNQPNGKNREFAQISHIGVSRNNREKGYGSLLLKFVESKARSQDVIILVVETNTNTAPFYEKNGYTINSKNRFGETVHLFKKLEET